MLDGDNQAVRELANWANSILARRYQQEEFMVSDTLFIDGPKVFNEMYEKGLV